MYKRIVHNIIEEHFGSACDISKVSAGIKVGVASELQMSSNILFRNLALSLRAYIVSVLISADDIDARLAKIISNIEVFGDFLQEYYDTGRVSVLIIHLKEFVDTLGRIVNLAKQGYDYSSELDLALTQVNSVANKISELNPEHWPDSVVRKYLRSYTSQLMNQIVARLAEDWTSEFIAINAANSVMFMGPVNLPYTPGVPDFAEFIAAGIFKQFPTKF